MPIASPGLLLVLGLAIAPPGPASAPSAPAGAAAYDAAAATADVDTLLDDRGKAYLEARARLEAHPELATTALLDRLGHGPDPAQRKRLLSVLSGMDAPGLAGMLAEQLGMSLAAGETADGSPWLDLLVARGEQAVDPLSELVRQQSYPLAERAVLLDALVMAMPTARVPELLVMLGRGHRSLQQQLRRSLLTRARDDEPMARTLRDSLGAVVGASNGAVRTRAAALGLLADLSPDDPTLSARLVQLIGEDAGPFVLQVAAIRASRGVEDEAVVQALSRAVERHAAPATALEQRSELVVAESLAALPPDIARDVADALDLARSHVPRLAAAGYALQTLPADHGWLAKASEHPWPEVRVEAIGRVGGACDRETVGRLATLAGPRDAGGDDDPRAARSAAFALGRCDGESALAAVEALVKEDALSYEQRAAAAQVLLERDPARGIPVALETLRRDPPPGLAEQLAAAMGHAGHASAAQLEQIEAGLCRAMTEYPNAARTAVESLHRLSLSAECGE